VKDHLTIQITALPTNIPETLSADVSKLEIDDALRAGELQLPDGVTLAVPPDLSICHVTHAVVEVLPEAGAAEEGEAEGEPKEGDEPKDEGDGDK
jgi:large subunit ribosomal protein L25